MGLRAVKLEGCPACGATLPIMCRIWVPFCPSDRHLCSKGNLWPGRPLLTSARRTNTPAAGQYLCYPPRAWQSKERKICKCAAHLCVGVVGVPGRPERFLPPYIPHQEVCVLHHYFFHVTSDGGGCVDHLVHQAWPEENRKVRFLHVQTRQQTFNEDLQLIEDSGFPSVVESNNDDLVLCETSKYVRQSQQVWYCEAAGQTEETKCRFTPDTNTPKHPNVVVWLFRPSESRGS